VARFRHVAVAAASALAVGAVLGACGGDGKPSGPVAATPHLTASPPHLAVPDLPAGPRVFFRHTGNDAHYGDVAVVPLQHPGGPRRFIPLDCVRVYATASDASCLRATDHAGTTHELDELDADWQVSDTVALAGLPSRTRLSPDGSLVATTTFLTHDSYENHGFVTATEIRRVGGETYGDLDDFRLVIDGHEVTAHDVNVWGVTFVDDNDFYATAATGGRTWLVHGDLSTRSLVPVRSNAECPSVSPDHTRVAYKVDRPGRGRYWSLAVLDLTTDRQVVLHGERANVDDQVEWLDDDTLLYGLPRPRQPGVTDVWAIRTRGDAAPRVFIKDAWSPSVVRP